MYTERIQEIYSDLSPGYRRVADYLVNNYRDAAFMTAAEVGRASKVDTTLVVRFAQRLGYPGYPELIEEVQERVKEDLRSAYEPSHRQQHAGFHLPEIVGRRLPQPGVHAPAHRSGDG